MFHSPLKTRSGKAVGNKKPADKRKAECTPSLVPIPAADKVTMDSSAVEAYVSNYLSRDDIFEKLSSKLVSSIEIIIKEAVTSAMKPVLDEVAALKKTVSTLQDKVRDLDTSLRCRTDDLEQYQRRNNLRVYGLPERPNEDTDVEVLKLFKEKLDVDLPLSCLDRSHRVGSKQEKRADGTVRPRAVIVRFTSYRDRRLVFSAKRKLKSTGISLREDLTTTRLELLKQATDKFGRGKTWTLDGKVMWLDFHGNRRMATKLSDLPI